MDFIELLQEDETIEIDKSYEQVSAYKKLSNQVIDLDMSIKLINKNNIYDLYEVHKDTDYLISQFDKKEIAEIAFYIAIKSYYKERKADIQIKKDIRTLGHNFNDVSEFLIKVVNPECFSNSGNKEGKINLAKNIGGGFEVYYLSLLGEKVQIVQNRTKPSAFVVLYNYSTYLDDFNKHIYPLFKNNGYSLEIMEKLKRIYFKR